MKEQENSYIFTTRPFKKHYLANDDMYRDVKNEAARWNLTNINSIEKIQRVPVFWTLAAWVIRTKLWDIGIPTMLDKSYNLPPSYKPPMIESFTHDEITIIETVGVFDRLVLGIWDVADVKKEIVRLIRTEPKHSSAHHLLAGLKQLEMDPSDANILVAVDMLSDLGSSPIFELRSLSLEMSNHFKNKKLRYKFDTEMTLHWGK